MRKHTDACSLSNFFLLVVQKSVAQFEGEGGALKPFYGQLAAVKK
jgi:hypothetical protein